MRKIAITVDNEQRLVSKEELYKLASEQDFETINLQILDDQADYQLCQICKNGIFQVGIIEQDPFLEEDSFDPIWDRINNRLHYQPRPNVLWTVGQKDLFD